jgi:hypothetical protein
VTGSAAAYAFIGRGAIGPRKTKSAEKRKGISVLTILGVVLLVLLIVILV